MSSEISFLALFDGVAFGSVPSTLRPNDGVLVPTARTAKAGARTRNLEIRSGEIRSGNGCRFGRFAHPPKTHLLRRSPYICVNFVNFGRGSGGLALAEIGVSRHRHIHV
jgi:hypothetical protein